MATTRKCAADGHEFQGRSTKGMCSKHYARFLRNGTTEATRDYVKGGQICTVDAIHGTALAHGLCASCEAKKRRSEHAYGYCPYGEPHPADGSADGLCSAHRWRRDHGKEMDTPIRKRGKK